MRLASFTRPRTAPGSPYIPFGFSERIEATPFAPEGRDSAPGRRSRPRESRPGHHISLLDSPSGIEATPFAPEGRDSAPGRHSRPREPHPGHHIFQGVTGLGARLSSQLTPSLPPLGAKRADEMRSSSVATGNILKLERLAKGLVDQAGLPRRAIPQRPKQFRSAPE